MSEWKTPTYPHRPVKGALYLNDTGKMWLCLTEPVLEPQFYYVQIWYFETNTIHPWRTSRNGHGAVGPWSGMNILEPDPE